MKAQKFFDPDRLCVDALDYIFVEWLIRNNLYRRFAENFSAHHPASASPCPHLRERIRYHISLDPSDYSGYVEGAFRFARTPEGYDFWKDVTSRWVKFIKSFNS